MKTPLLLTGLLFTSLAAASFAEDAAPKEECKMMKKAPTPEPTCCCEKMMAKKEAAVAAPNLDALVEKMMKAKGDQVLDAFAAVLNKLLAERKEAQDKPAADASAPATAPEHHH